MAEVFDDKCSCYVGAECVHGTCSVTLGEDFYLYACSKCPYNLGCLYCYFSDMCEDSR